MVDDRVDRGVDLNRPMPCSSCGLEKPPTGAAVYGSYRLCNDCLLDFTLALASGRVNNVYEYMTRDPDGGALPPTDLSSARDRQTAQVNPLTGRDKFMPSTEPSQG
jgi:hypothetical protein